MPLEALNKKKAIIMRYKDVVWEEGALMGDTSNYVNIYRYPFRALPLLESHLHPKFAIYDAGRKLKTLAESSSTQDELKEVLLDYPSLGQVKILYDVWIQTPPRFALQDTSYIMDPKDVLVEYSSDEGSYIDGNEGSDYHDRTNRTKSGRGDGFHIRPRTRSVARTRSEAAERDNLTNRIKNDDDDQTRAKSGRGRARTGKTPAKQKKAPAVVKKRKVLSDSHTHNQQLLSEATLSRFNQQSREAAWTGDSIRLWSTLPKKRKLKVSSLFH